MRIRSHVDARGVARDEARGAREIALSSVADLIRDGAVLAAAAVTPVAESLEAGVVDEGVIGGIAATSDARSFEAHLPREAGLAATPAVHRVRAEARARPGTARLIPGASRLTDPVDARLSGVTLRIAGTAIAGIDPRVHARRITGDEILDARARALTLAVADRALQRAVRTEAAIPGIVTVAETAAARHDVVGRARVGARAVHAHLAAGTRVAARAAVRGVRAGVDAGAAAGRLAR